MNFITILLCMMGLRISTNMASAEPGPHPLHQHPEPLFTTSAGSGLSRAKVTVQDADRPFDRTLVLTGDPKQKECAPWCPRLTPQTRQLQVFAVRDWLCAHPKNETFNWRLQVHETGETWLWRHSRTEDCAKMWSTEQIVEEPDTDMVEVFLEYVVGPVTMLYVTALCLCRTRKEPRN